jgi:hypothetical protein
MWDFQKLEVYQKSKNFCKKLLVLLVKRVLTKSPMTS